jgi:hypothetical protein
VIGLHGAVAVYADDGGAEVTVPVRALMIPNARWQFVYVYAEPERAKVLGLEDVATAVADGAVRVGEEAGLPLHVFRWPRPPGRTARSRRGPSARSSSTSPRDRCSGCGHDLRLGRGPLKTLSDELAQQGHARVEPDRRHSLHADEDSAVLYSVAVPIRAPLAD